MMRGIQVPILEFDEIWGYVGKKQRRTERGELDNTIDHAGSFYAGRGDGIEVFINHNDADDGPGSTGVRW